MCYTYDVVFLCVARGMLINLPPVRRMILAGCQMLESNHVGGRAHA